MVDQAERIILEAEETPVLESVGRANAALDSFEKKSDATHGKVIRISDQTRSSVQRLIASLEKQAETYGKSGVDRLISQRDQLLQRYSREPQAIDAITRSYEKMIAVEEKVAREAHMAKAAKEAEEALKKESEAIKSFGERVTLSIENPLQGARSAVGSFLSSLGPFGVGVAAGATALIGLGVATFEAAKSLGEYGTRVKDAELRTGLTAKEVGQFGFAARAVGQDISVVERLMRGLSQAANENSTEGEKARATLRGMGVDFHTATGEMKPTAEILVEIAEGLNKLPAGFLRDAAAMELFKKVGVEAIPFMTELNENLRVAHEQGFGPSEEDVRRFQEYQREVTVLETKWDRLVRKFKEGLVISVTWVGKGADWFLNNVGTAGDDELQRREEIQANRDAEQIRAVGGYGASMSVSAHRKESADLDRRAPEILKNRDATLKQIAELQAERQKLTGDFDLLQSILPTQSEQGRWNRADIIQQEIARLQKMLGDAEAAVKRQDIRAGKEEVEHIRARFFGTHDGMERAYSYAKKDVQRLQKELLEPDKPLTKAQAQDLDRQLRDALANEARQKAALDAVAKSTEELKEFRREAAAFAKKGDESELSATEKVYYQRDLLLKQAEKVKAAESEIAAIRKAADQQADVLSKKAWDEFEKFESKQQAERSKSRAALMMPSKEQIKEWEQDFAAQERIADLEVQEQRDELRRRAARAQRMAELTAGDHKPVAMSDAERRELSARTEAVAAQQAYRTRLDLAVQLADIEAERISKEENAAKRSVLAAQAQKDLFTEIAQAQDQFEEKQAQLQRKRQEELQSQLDGLQKQAERLIDVLFTKPANFGKDLVNTIRSAVLKPVTETLGGAVANLLHPLIYGADGRGGMNAMLRGGSKDPVRIATDQNTAATMQNSAVMAGLTAILAASMGMAAPRACLTASSVTSLSSPPISVPFVPSPGSSGMGVPSFSGTVAATTASADPSGLDAQSLPSRTASPSFNPMTMAFPDASGAPRTTGGSALSNLRDTWSGLKSFAGFGHTVTDSQGGRWVTVGNESIPIDSFSGYATAIGRSPAAGAAGMMLAQHGLLGESRGTWAGIAEGTAGGAMLGFQMGGPFGAAIGAGVGFGIGVGEKVFGVKSLAQTAHDDIKSAYGVDIPANSGTIKQVVNIAQSQFGGSISVAVRSPSVRQLVMLYSEATGQKMPLSATTPYAGSLVEQGGRLYQQASYQDGQAHVYASNLPTLGGIAASVYPTPSSPTVAGGAGPTYLSLNISGSDAANFMTGQFVTPQFVADQSMAAQYSSYGRTQQSANIQLPGLTVA